MGESPKTLLFIHIPKTGGTTVRRIMRRQYAPPSLFEIGRAANEGIAALRRLPAEERGRIGAVQGHMSFGLHRYLDGPFAYVTLMRDPVERAVSFYYFVRSQPEHPLHRAVKDMTLRQCVESGSFGQLSNGQTRLICGDCKPGNVGMPTANELDERDLEKAERNIRESFVVVGLQERFDETLILLKRKLGWRFPWYVRSNVSRARPTASAIPEDVRRLIEDRNRLDIELYRYVARRFDEQVNGLGRPFRAEVTGLRVLNPLFLISPLAIRELVRSGVDRLPAPASERIIALVRRIEGRG